MNDPYSATLNMRIVLCNLLSKLDELCAGAPDDMIERAEKLLREALSAVDELLDWIADMDAAPSEWKFDILKRQYLDTKRKVGVAVSAQMAAQIMAAPEPARSALWDMRSAVIDATDALPEHGENGR